MSSRTSATSLSFSFKTVFMRSQRPFWSFSATHVANLVLSNSPLLFAAHTARLSLSAMLLECQQTLNKSRVSTRRSRALIPQSRDMHVINIRKSKLHLAPFLSFCTISTNRANTVKMQTCIWLIKHILTGSTIYTFVF